MKKEIILFKLYTRKLHRKEAGISSFYPPPPTNEYAVSYERTPLLEYNLLLFRYLLHNYWLVYKTLRKYYLLYRKLVIVFNEFIDICIWTISYIFKNIIDKMERIS